MALKDISRKIRLPFQRAMLARDLRRFHESAHELADCVDMAMSFGRGSILKFRMMQKRSEILGLARRVESLKPKVIVEIGTAQGGTLFLWSQLASKLVVSCDLAHSPAVAPSYEWFPSPDSGCRIELLQGDSHTPEFKQRLRSALGGEKADFLFIDGDHTESGVAQDYFDYREFVRPGGIIAFHDIVERQRIPTNQVGRFWNRLKAVDESAEEFVDSADQTGFGIGLVRVSDGKPRLEPA